MFISRRRSARPGHRSHRTHSPYTLRPSSRRPRPAIGLFIGDPEVAALYLKGLGAQAELTPNEQLRFGMLLQSLFLNIQALYVRFEIHELEPGYFSRQERLVRAVLSQAGASIWWKRNKAAFRPEFVAAVDAVPLRTPGDNAA